MKNLSELRKHIISNIDENWSTLEKVRYVYLESGKYLQKHTEFFLSLDGKLSDKLSPKRIDKVYMGRLSKDEWNKMVCKTGAEFIKTVFDELKIKSSLVETVRSTKIKGVKHDLHHYFLKVDIDGKNIFLTPAADYSYIQNGFCTLRFGSKIKYIVDGEPFYKGEEIDHITLTRKDMKELDDKLGFTTKIIKDNRKGNEEIVTEYMDDILKNDKTYYIDYLASTTNFYKSIMPSEDDKKEFVSFSDPRNNWNFVIDNICKRTGKRIGQIVGFKYKHNDFVSRTNFKDWCEEIEKLFNSEDYNEKDVYYANPNLLFNKSKALCNSIIIFYNKLVNNSVKEEDVKKFSRTFVRLLNEASKHFIDEKFVIEPKDSKNYVSNIYINHKFSTLFPIFMDANGGYKTDFNSKGYSEQNDMIKRTLELMFQELNSKNLLKEPDPEFKINPIFKRINLYTVKKRGKDEYFICFAITDSDTKGTRSSYLYKYDLTDNTFEKTSLAKIVMESSKNGKYEILSNRLKSELGEIEASGNDDSIRLIEEEKSKKIN